MPFWSFLTNHGLVLTHIGRYPDSTGLEIAQAVGITERAARKIVADLLAEEYIQLEKVGRRNRYRLNTARPLRHPVERTATVGELLMLLGRDRHSKRQGNAEDKPLLQNEEGYGRDDGAMQMFRRQ
jgi:hypothetical protein